jgi:hypothetical protein
MCCIQMSVVMTNYTLWYSSKNFMFISYFGFRNMYRSLDPNEIEDYVTNTDVCTQHITQL